MNRKALGKGIDALIPDFELGVPEEEKKKAGSAMGARELPIEEIVPNTQQPRKTFDDEKLTELVESIKENGIIQPVVVQTAPGGEGYELIVGERRWRACQKAGLKKIPAIIRETDDEESLALAIIENIHRADLNPIEEAEAYQRLASEHGLTQEAISRRVGKNRASVANFLRLLRLPKVIQEDLISGKLSMGHARALLGLESEKLRLQLRDEIVNHDLNVRRTETRVKLLNSKSSLNRQSMEKPETKKNVFLKSLERDLGRTLGTQVEIQQGKKGGKLVVSYYDEEDLERIRGMIIPKFS